MNNVKSTGSVEKSITAVICVAKAIKIPDETESPLMLTTSGGGLKMIEKQTNQRT